MINAKRFGRGQLAHPARGRVDKALQPRHLFFSTGRGGAAGRINLLFIDHLHEMSRGHFVDRKLERKYGTCRYARN